MASVVLISGSFNGHAVPSMDPYLSGAGIEFAVFLPLSATVDEYVAPNFTIAISGAFYSDSYAILTPTIDEYVSNVMSHPFPIPGMQLNSASIAPSPVVVRETASHDMTRFKKTYSLARFNPKLRRIK